MPQSGSSNNLDASYKAGNITARNAPTQEANSVRSSNNEGLDKDGHKPGYKEGAARVFASFADFMHNAVEEEKADKARVASDPYRDWVYEKTWQ